MHWLTHTRQSTGDLTVCSQMFSCHILFRTPCFIIYTHDAFGFRCPTNHNAEISLGMIFWIILITINTREILTETEGVYGQLKGKLYYQSKITITFGVYFIFLTELL